jgi:hypothetical protein
MGSGSRDASSSAYPDVVGQNRVLHNLDASTAMLPASMEYRGDRHASANHDRFSVGSEKDEKGAEKGKSLRATHRLGAKCVTIT